MTMLYAAASLAMQDADGIKYLQQNDNDRSWLIAPMRQLIALVKGVMMRKINAHADSVNCHVDV